ncbi:hypothetical protein IKG07_00285 [Candidatus Saccharibacteria bacterium]|nr:hypothetical protein [Candidatus Saccharibacteria bacterium]
MGTKLKKKTAKTKKVEKPFDYKTTIWVGLALVALMIVIMAILKFSQNEKFDSSYFHDADGKIVLTMSKEMSALDDSEWESDVTHVVYYYEGNKIIGARAFYEYATESEAEEAYKHLDLGPSASGKRISGKFVVFDVNKSQYENMTVEDLKASRELLKEIDALILDYGEGYVKPRVTE